MKVFEIRGGFGFEHLVEADRPTPRPGPREVLVRIRAASLNYRDLLMVQGKYQPKMKLPSVPLSDGAGEVMEIGSEVAGWQLGDRVVSPFFPRWVDGRLTLEKAGSALGGEVDGMLQEFVVLPADALLSIPEHLSFAQAATLPCAAVTAWNGLFVSGQLQPGQTVLLQGTGGVSLFGLQFAKLAGARVILISSSDEKIARARALGADETINYRTLPDWEKRVLELTDSDGVDLTLEVGGTGTLAKTLKATRMGGQVSLIGVLTGLAGEVPIGAILHKMLTVQGIYVGSRAMFDVMTRAIVRHRLEPVIDQIFSFPESVAALRHLESGRHFGKIVIRMD